MNLNLEQKKMVVTGGSRGIGFAIAEMLAGEGAELLITSRSRENLESAAKKLEQSGGNVHIRILNSAKKEDIDSTAQWIIETWGYVDGILINTGGPPVSGVLDPDDRMWHEAFENHFLFPYRLLQNLVPLMEKNYFGRILAIASSGVKQPIPHLVLSNSMRSALIAFLKTLSLNYASKGILVNAILPGAIDTERLRDNLHKAAEKAGKSVDEIKSKRLTTIPAGRFGEAEEISGMAAYLLSPANRYITAQWIAVDGGAIKSLF